MHSGFHGVSLLVLLGNKLDCTIMLYQKRDPDQQSRITELPLDTLGVVCAPGHSEKTYLEFVEEMLWWGALAIAYELQLGMRYRSSVR